MSGKKSHNVSKGKMTPEAVARIYSAKARAGDGTIPKEGFEARAAAAAAAHSPVSKQKSK